MKILAIAATVLALAPRFAGGQDAPFTPSVAVVPSVGVASTVESLRSMPGARGRALQVLGYAAEGDRGQGLFLWSPSYAGQDDGGVHVVPAPRAGSGAWVRQFAGAVRPEWFGARCDGVADDTGALQRAVAHVSAAKGADFHIELGACTLRLTAPISIGASLRIVGQGVAPYEAVLGKPGGGSWLLLDHPGVGVQVNAAGPLSGVMFEKFGTRRNQPAPAPGWAPRPFDFDFVVSNADVAFIDVMLLNPTKGIRHDRGGYGRLSLERLRGQPLQVGVEVSMSADTFRASNVHFWPFWQDDPLVHAYTLQSLDAFWLYRTDNPMFSNVFTIFARSGIRFSQNASGAVSKLHLANADFDRGTFGLWVDPSVKRGITAQLDNVSIQGESGRKDTKGIFVQGSNSRVSFGNLRIDVSAQNAIRLEGNANELNIANLEVVGYDQNAAGFPAVEALRGNTVAIAGAPRVVEGGKGPKFGGTGTVSVLLERPSATR